MLWDGAVIRRRAPHHFFASVSASLEVAKHLGRRLGRLPVAVLDRDHFLGPVGPYATLNEQAQLAALPGSWSAAGRRTIG